MTELFHSMCRSFFGDQLGTVKGINTCTAMARNKTLSLVAYRYIHNFYVVVMFMFMTLAVH